MESNLRNRDFEDYVKQNADQYRMFPSEKVWKSINNTLHTRRKWYGFGLGFLLLLTGTAVTWVMVSYPVSKNLTTTLNAPDNITAPTGNQQPISLSTARVTTDENAVTAKVIPFTSSNNGYNATTSAKPASLEVTIEDASIETSLITEEPLNKPSIAFIPQQLTAARSEKIPVTTIAAPPINNHPLTLVSFVTGTEPAAEAGIPEDKAVDAHQKDLAKQTPAVRPEYPLTIESVTNAYQPRQLRKKLIWQLFVTPTISYRKLDENKSFDNSAGLSYPFASLTDVNKAVTHKPDMGLQLGISASYPVTRSLRIRGGLQFNINRYDIKAFASNPEIASINLSASNGVNSVSTWTPYRNYGGYKSDWLKNFYYSVSIPVGIEMRLIGNKKTSFGIAGTLQPTYIVKDRAYLISTDYKNYAQVPWLIRHVNLNTGFETFVNYTNGKTRWQIGPQVRYQVLSSFHNKYPVKENLFDFGIKVAVSLNE